jgi:hypothetical protein
MVIYQKSLNKAMFYPKRSESNNSNGDTPSAQPTFEWVNFAQFYLNYMRSRPILPIRQQTDTAEGLETATENLPMKNIIYIKYRRLK